MGTLEILSLRQPWEGIVTDSILRGAQLIELDVANLRTASERWMKTRTFIGR